MAAYISVPRDLTKVKSKVAFNLTKRQLLCFGTAALIGVPLFFVLRDSGGNTAATLGMMAVMLPAAWATWRMSDLSCTMRTYSMTLALVGVTSISCSR